MRGKQSDPQAIVQHLGITPADAGENSSIASSILYIEGSPPRMRGKHVAAAQVKPRRRITPADAGKTPI